MKLLNGYIGIKFNAVKLKNHIPKGSTKYIADFKYNGKRLLEYNMAPANGGNMSLRYKNGFLITSSGCNLGFIEDNEIIYVKEYFIENKIVKFHGPNLPSSETFLHALLYQEKKEIKSIIHAHDEFATSIEIKGLLAETEKEEPYGTLELAMLALNTFRKGNNIFILKNHGYVAVGNSLTDVTNTIINMHNKLINTIRNKI